jgi:hypothetical protein
MEDRHQYSLWVAHKKKAALQMCFYIKQPHQKWRKCATARRPDMSLIIT